MNNRYNYNRQKLVQSLPTGSSAVIIAGNAVLSRNADTSYPFRQDSNVLYLSDIRRPRVALLADIEKDRWSLVVPDLTHVEKIFDDSDGWEQTVKQAGLNDCIEWRHAISLLKERSAKGAIYYNYPNKRRQYGTYANPFQADVLSRLKRGGIFAEDVRPYTARLRMIKQNYEIDAITQAVRITELALSGYINKPQQLIGTTEQAVADAITANFYTRGVVHAYDPIVAFANNAATPHHYPDDSMIRSGGAVLFDVGAEYNGYAADISRTLSIGSSNDMQKLIDDVTNVQQVLIRSISPGGSWKELHACAVKELTVVAGRHRYMKNQSIDDLFPYAIGHFLGLDVHDAGDYAAPFREGMVFTVEPGLHSREHGIGVRIEDDIVVTKTGAKIIN